MRFRIALVVRACLVLAACGAAARADAQATYAQGPDVIAPTILKRVSPVYTPEALRNKITGTVTIEAIIDADNAMAL